MASRASARHVTRSGLTVIALRVPGPRVAIDVHLAAGPAFERAGDAGLSHFLEHMVHRGTRRHPSAHAQAQALEALGGELEAATYVDHGMLRVSLPCESLAAALPLVGDAYREPLFTGIEVERAIVLEEIQGLIDERGAWIDADDLVRGAAFPEQALGRPITGTLREVERFDRRRLRAHHARHYTAENTVVTLAGSFDPDRVVRLAARAFAGLGAGRPPRAPVPQGAAPRRTWVRHAGSQAELRLAFVAPGIGDPREPATDLLLRVLDDGMSTRLYHEVTDRRGLCYDVSASYEAYPGVGLFDVAASTTHERLPAVVDTVLDVLVDLAAKGPTAAELEHAHRRARWEVKNEERDPEDLSAFYGLAALQGGAESPRARLRELCAVSRDDVRAAAAALVRAERLALVVVGEPGARARRAVERRLSALA